MNKTHLLSLTLIVGILSMLGLLLLTNKQSSSFDTPSIVTILMKEDSFEPQTLQIKKGTTVIFKNEDKIDRWPASNLHPTHGIYPEFDPQKPIPPSEVWQFTFDKEGSWKYHDHLIPSIRGVIVVNK